MIVNNKGEKVCEIRALRHGSNIELFSDADMDGMKAVVHMDGCADLTAELKGKGGELYLDY